MAVRRRDGEVHPGWHWGPFTFRLPLYHTRLEWPELLQGIFVAGATGLGLVPLLTEEFGLSFEESIACIFIQSILISSAPILFGEPFAPGWITPAFPLVLLSLLAVDGSGSPVYPTPEHRFQFMTAVTLDFAVLTLVMGCTGLGRKFVHWLPPALKGGIVMGAAIAAFKRVFLDDADRYLYQQPISTVVAVSLCLLLTFSVPAQRLKSRYPWLRRLAALGFLPGFALAGAVGPLFGEMQFDVQWGLFLPPFQSLWEKATPFAIGWPGWAMFLDGLPLALMAYTIFFGDLITGMEILHGAAKDRADEVVPVSTDRSHYVIGVRNVCMALAAPFFPTQGCLWTGVHVIIVQRWREGRRSMDSLFSGISSYYVCGIPVFYFLQPLLTALRPLMGIALSLTLVLTGFACAYVAMALPRTSVERGVILLTGVSLAVFSPWWGLGVGIVAYLTLVGIRD